MDRALQACLDAQPNVCGFVVADYNGLLIAAKGQMEDKGHLAGRFTAMIRDAERKVSYSNPPTPTESGCLVLESSESKQLVVKKVGEFTIALLVQSPQPSA